MMARSITLAVPSQQRLLEIFSDVYGALMWLMLEEEEEEAAEKGVGQSTKVNLDVGISTLRRSCHSFTFTLSSQRLFSAWKQGEKKLTEQHIHGLQCKVSVTLCHVLSSCFWLLSQRLVKVSLPPK